ncbi:peptidoglycan binding domain-containing protein [Kitasatospora sp. RB6PN24]|uniref:peptidoglycan binding domain-containing protein n=1 Tax=Kitasatospora humi TaxID=2893891 RepID=UPI001E641FE2|nr:peptidoglycan binding domain-containing protein [Kitasatospora humi]MCC9310242.1 peptidoglycan binding domain-containing protein [Kitasatospora humi]
MSSRESDSAHPSSRRGAGGADAYPSGTPPYGIPGLGGGFDPFGRTPGFDVPPGGPQEPEPETPKTETTLTTKISINIPGSRPIPPVVVRSTVKPEEGAGEPPAAEPPAAPGGPRHRSAPPAAPVLGVMDQGGRTSTPPDLPPQWRGPAEQKSDASESESTGEWFRPRQKSRPEPVATTPAAGTPRFAAGRPPAGDGRGAAQPGGYPADPYATGARDPFDPGARDPFGGGAPDPFDGGVRDPFDPGARDPFDPGARDPFGGGAPDPFGAGPAGPGAPQQGMPPFGAGPAQGNSGGFPGPAQGNAAPFAGEPGQGHGPLGDDAAAGNPVRPAADPTPAAGRDVPPHTAAAPAAAPRPTGTPGAPGRFARPQQPISTFPGGPARPSGEPEDTQIGGFDPITGEGRPTPGRIPGGPPPTGLYGTPPTAPGRPGPAPGLRGAAAGFPNSPAAQDGSLSGEAAEPSAPGADAESSPAPKPPAPKPAAAKPKGRSKVQKLLVTGAGGVLFVGAAAYGTGLMLNQTDVPRGTKVLGVDIGGNSRDQAIHTLDSTIGKIGQQPIQLKLGNQALTLDPAAAGLGFDTTATVDGLTKHSYNPSDVLQSLTGGSKNVPPVVHIDQAKLKAALDGLSASSAQGLKEGYIQFSDTGDPVVVPGQPGQAVDDSTAVAQVAQSYQDRADGKTDAPVNLPVTAAQPKVATQTLQQTADGLGKAITSSNVVVQAGNKQFLFGKKAAAKALTLVPDGSGNLVPKWDLDQLGSMIGNTFDKLRYKKDDSTLAPITTQDVANAIASVYDKNTAAERTYRFHM